MVVCEFNFCLRLKWLECLKLELLVVLLDDSIFYQIDDMVAASDFSLRCVELLWHQLLPHSRQLFNKVLRAVIKTDEHDIEIAVQNAEVEAEAKLLLGCKLLDSLHMLELKGQVFLFLERMFFLLLTIQSFVLFAVNIHAFQNN